MLPRELPKDAIYIYKATKAVNKYSRKGCKEVRQRRQERLVLPREVPNDAIYIYKATKALAAKRAGQRS